MDVYFLPTSVAAAVATTPVVAERYTLVGGTLPESNVTRWAFLHMCREESVSAPPLSQTYVEAVVVGTTAPTERHPKACDGGGLVNKS